MGALRDRPTRISHRSGHAWLLNTQARLRLGLDPAGGLLLEADDLLRHRLERDFPDLTAVSARLARTGITAVTDAGVHNGPVELAALRAASARGELRQRCLVLGTEALTKGSAAPAVEPGLDGLHDIDGLDSNGMVAVGPVKIVLAESDLPGLDELVRRTRAAGDRGVAVHAVSRESLVLAAVALAASAPAPPETAGHPRPRVEHASVAPPEIVALLRDSQARVVTQPGFVHQHGDRYRRTVDAEDQPWLYRLRAWIEAGVELSAGSDAPYGPDDPWLAMRAAVHRRTAGGRVLGAAEALTPEQALGLFSASPGLSAGPGPADPSGGRPRSPAVGDPADLCLLQLPWRQAREELSADLVRATVIDGRIVWSSSTSST
jgi:predicted amidohydrolase YtcJ